MYKLNCQHSISVRSNTEFSAKSAFKANGCVTESENVKNQA